MSAALQRRPLVICEHAITRYCERVEPVSAAEAERVLGGAAFQCAAQFGAQIVRKPGRFRAVLTFSPVGATVVTVLPDDNLPAQLRPVRLGGFPWLRDQGVAETFTGGSH